MSWKQPVLTAEFAAVGVTALLEAIRRVDDSDPLLPGVLERDLRRVARGAADRGDTARAGDPVRSREGVRALHHAQLPPPLRAARVLGDPLQPRVAAAAARLRDAEDLATGPPRSASGSKSELLLGSLDARRDWGYAGDYVRAMWLVLQQDEPDDYVIASGKTHSVQELAALAFAHVGPRWEDHVRVDEALVRGKAELYDIVGDASKARERLGWVPHVDFEGLVQLLVDADVERLRSRVEPVETLADI